MKTKKIEERHLRVLINRGGSGSIGYKVNLPTLWAKDIGVSESDRTIKMIKDGDKIIIVKDKE